MGQFPVLVLLLVLGCTATCFSQDVGESNKDEVPKPGGCSPESPHHDNEPPPCPDPCEGIENCTTTSCTIDSHCDGSLKCCKTRCGMECVPPYFRNPCQGKHDCPLGLKCCNGVCDSDCIYQQKSRVTKGSLSAVSKKKAK
ncbi:WAP four-disulfide core domain protein 5-like [Pelobates fuscus]|uniref:WAP four-disulfide core domain protein 5-like n=1 Tax=Pelobates fuscus TaxID=191477 RepID=UPI002FE49322